MEIDRRCRCVKCKYAWHKRDYSVNAVPKKCPKCGSPNWNKPKNDNELMSLLVAVD